MADRRTHRSRLRLFAIPPVISGAEFQALCRIEHGHPDKERMREVLASKGLISSKVASKAFTTRLGVAAMKNYSAAIMDGMKDQPSVHGDDARGRAGAMRLDTLDGGSAQAKPTAIVEGMKR